MSASEIQAAGSSVGLQSTAVAAAVPALGNAQALPPLWVALPFVILLLMIATAPLFYHRFWERHYPKVSIGLGALVAIYYGLMMDDGPKVLNHTLQEYLSFIALVSSLFIVSGGILIRIQRKGSPLVNGLLLFSGALLSNLVGTTGASMLLIRPYLRMNAGRIRPFHIVFFIFIISNIGGALTPIGDPPLFLGFLKGVPFFWVLSKVWVPWLLSVFLLLALFMVLDARAGKRAPSDDADDGSVEVKGRRNFLYLAVIIVSVFLDPAVIQGFPSLQEMFHLPFGIREIIMAGVAVAAYMTSNRDALKGNEFNFEPIKEVAFLFLGIFATMIPALELIGSFAARHAGEFSVTRFYWMTGFLSGVLDNAPTYLNFLAGASGKFGINIDSVPDVRNFAAGIASPVPGDVTSDIYLKAISIASVFFGALTYIGNAPNFMVRNIAAQAEADVPDFLEYVCKYSVPVLIPLFLVLWLLFFNF